MKLNVWIALAESFLNAYLSEAKCPKRNKRKKVIDEIEMPLTRVHVFTNTISPGTYKNRQIRLIDQMQAHARQKSNIQMIRKITTKESYITS